MKWLFKRTFSWFDLATIAIISGLIGVWGWWALLMGVPFAIIATIGECVTEDKGETK